MTMTKSITAQDDVSCVTYGTAEAAAQRGGVRRGGRRPHFLQRNSNGGGISDVESMALTRKETKLVNRSKLCMYVAILVSAIAVGVTAYILLYNEQTATFSREFQVISREVAVHADVTVKNVIGQLQLLSTALTSLTDKRSVRNNFPNVTLENFDLRFQDMQVVSPGLRFVEFLPLVTEASKVGYEEYARANQRWIDIDLQRRGWQAETMSIPPEIYPYNAALFPRPRRLKTAANIVPPTAVVVNSLKRRQLQPGSENTDAFTTAPAANDTTETADATTPVELTDYTNPGELYAPVWQLATVPRNRSIINLDLLTHPELGPFLSQVRDQSEPLLGKRMDVGFLEQFTTPPQEEETDDDQQPRATMAVPVYTNLNPPTQQVSGFALGAIRWDAVFAGALGSKAAGPIRILVQEACDAGFWYSVQGPQPTFGGYGSGSSEYQSMQVKVPFASFVSTQQADDEGVECTFTLVIQPTREMELQYRTDRPLKSSFTVAGVFILTACAFALYDFLVQRRQKKLLSTAQHNSDIVSSLFPKDVQRRMIDDAKQQAKMAAEQKPPSRPTAALQMAAKSFRIITKRDAKDSMLENLSSNNNNNNNSSGGGGNRLNESITGGHLKTKPIAEQFQAATISFADIVGFTAWSSMREPEQVFLLLETIYHAFDQIAKRRRIFKVETVGDCYVAVAGLPEPRSDHAVAITRFAHECLAKMGSIVKRLEVTLGPDTTDLVMRVGLHSGPVTAGVLRGDRARFQLFGDTVNTTSRIETTGMPNRIHVSQETADLLEEAGKGHWLVRREEKVTAKGKGELTTYWIRSTVSSKTLETDQESDSDEDGGGDESDEDDVSRAGGKQLTDKHERLVNWNTKVLCGLLQEIKSVRVATAMKRGDSLVNLRAVEELERSHKGTMVVDEVQAVISLPKLPPEQERENDNNDDTQNVDPDDIDLPLGVESQVRDYCQAIAAMYRDSNPFHNFEHASHVTMSIVKLLSRMEIQEAEAISEMDEDHTYGITSDPLTQFSIVLSALIHDVNHPGVPNMQLIKENAPIASVYKNKSVAEQQSVDLAWELLMDPAYADFRQAIYTNESEFKLFRQLVVNSVMATDIMDNHIAALRKMRWQRAFEEVSSEEEPTIANNRRATIIIEHIIQASDVAHTMQHWMIYRKWNEKFFEECIKAHMHGRAEKDPAKNWYEGELGFFDYYIIPLAKKLKDCGVFGVASDEYLQYAQQNRREWERSGRGVVAGMVESVRKKAELEGWQGKK